MVSAGLGGMCWNYRKEPMDNLKEAIIDLLVSTEREGIHELVNYLDEGGYFESPASTKHHGVFPGGLAKHSHEVLILMNRFNRDYNLNIPLDTTILTALLHDVCKVGKYALEGTGYKYIKGGPPGHGSLSVNRIKQYIDLTDLEEKMILYHMGVYECYEFEGKGEYPLRGGGLANVWFNHPEVKLLYICDELATMKEKAQ